MPLVFVHGVATRQSPEYKAQVYQRDILFKTLVLPRGAQVFDPDWGSNAVKFTPALPWLPEPGAAEAFGMGATQPGSGQIGIGRLAKKNPAAAVDVAFEVGLALRATAATKAGQLAQALSEKDLKAFEAAVRYLETGVDADVFQPEGTDAAFLADLAAELAPHANEAAATAEAMGWGSDTLKWLGDGLKELVSPVSNVASDAVLRIVRRPLSEQVALFLGDIFVYLRWRETDGPAGTANRIFAPIIADLSKAAKLRSKEDPLIVVAHSLGGVVLYDLFSDRRAVQKIEADSGAKFVVDAWITVGSQPSLFADMGLYATQADVNGLRPRPSPISAWLNVYDYTDVLSFCCAKVFRDVEDFEFDNVTGLFNAHSAYFQRPSFYKRLRERLKGLKTTA